jgi:hypothetical protein
MRWRRAESTCSGPCTWRAFVTRRARATALRQITGMADRLAAINVLASEAEQPLQRIIETATSLLQQLRTDAAFACGDAGS